MSWAPCCVSSIAINTFTESLRNPVREGLLSQFNKGTEAQGD